MIVSSTGMGFRQRSRTSIMVSFSSTLTQAVARPPDPSPSARTPCQSFSCCCSLESRSLNCRHRSSPSRPAGGSLTLSILAGQYGNCVVLTSGSSGFHASESFVPTQVFAVYLPALTGGPGAAGALPGPVGAAPGATGGGGGSGGAILLAAVAAGTGGGGGGAGPATRPRPAARG
jgi:hypothetical protein